MPLAQLAGAPIEGGDAVIGHGLALGGLVAVALLGHHMQEALTAHLLDVAQGLDDRVDVVTVDGTDIVEPELLEQGARHQHALHVLFPASDQMTQLRHAAQGGLAALAHGRVDLARQQACEMVGDGADGRRDGHLVVVEDDDQIDIHRARVVQGLERHAGAQRPVADDGDHVASLALLLAAKAIPSAALIEVLEWPTPKQSYSLSQRFGKAGESVFLAQARACDRVARSGSYAGRPGGRHPRPAVGGGVEDVVQTDSQLDDAETGREMAAGLRDGVDEKAPQLVGDRGQRCSGKARRSAGRVDRCQQRMAVQGDTGVTRRAVGHGRHSRISETVG
jgi:hypothetical protein